MPDLLILDAWYFTWFLHTFALRVCLSKNGTVVGAVPKDMKGPLYPTIAVHSQNEEYEISSLNIKLLLLLIYCDWAIASAFKSQL